MADEIRSEELTEEKSEKKADKSGKPAKKKGPGLGSRMAKYFRDLKGEFKKVIWPTFPTVARNTGVTLIVCAIMAVLICVVDFGLYQLIQFVLSL